MVFSTPVFYLFFAAVMLLLYFIRGQRERQIMLVIASYFFYAYFDIRFLLLMVGETYLVYWLALRVEKYRDSDLKRSKRYVVFGVCLTIAVLIFFKYTNFILDSFHFILRREATGALRIMLPIGISFYTFQSLSYLVDVYRNREKASRSFLKITLYITFFPGLVAGPVMRSKDFLPQLETNPPLKAGAISEGLQIFLFGLIKKLIIADNLSMFVDQVFGAPSAFNTPSVILAVLAYSLQIYCDFSGYSDMAIGVATCMGYKLIRNFNLPYLAYNPTEFWKRWHISLSVWLQEYLYFSLGGNKKGGARTYINLMLTMLIGGLWHGASWNFVIWGALHGLALIVHKLFLKLTGHPRGYRSPSGFVKAISILCNYLFVSFAWIFFRSTDYQTTVTILKKIFFITPEGLSQPFVYAILFAVLMLAVHVFIAVRHNREGFYVVLDYNKFYSKLVVAAVIWLIICFAYANSSPFIYFQF